MAAQDGEGVYGSPSQGGVVYTTEHKLSQNGPMVKDSTGKPRSGVFYAGNASLVTGKTNMSYDVAAFEAAICRGRTKGTSFPTNDAVVNVATTAAPGSNSRIDIIYLQQQEYIEGDASTQAVIGVVQGVAAASPTAPALPSGAIELARAVVPAGITATTSATITQTAKFTAAAGGVIPFRNTTERDADTCTEGQAGWLLDTHTLIVWDGTTWITLASDSGWITPTLGTGWTQDANNPIQYRALGDEVVFRGVAVTNGTTANIFTLNSGYRPAFASTSGSPVKKYPLVSDSTTVERVFIYPNGVVQQSAAAARNGVSLDGIRFRRV